MGHSRSLIFIPGNNARFLEKSKTIDSDIICFDLEDSVPFNEKDKARELIRNTIDDIHKIDTTKKILVSVRINAPGSHMVVEDLKKILVDGIDAVVIPKVETDLQISKLSELIKTIEKENNISKESVKIIPSIESALGVVNAYSIAKSDQRNSALIFGIFDFLHDMKIDTNNIDILTDYMYGRAKVPVDARAARLDSIDSIWQNLDDIVGLKNDLILGRKLGYTGKCIIHPSQIEHVHKVFSPSKEDIQWAKKVVSALDESSHNELINRGAIKLDGKMIDAVHYKQAQRILESILEK